jgi:hypothetical protein
MARRVGGPGFGDGKAEEPLRPPLESIAIARASVHLARQRHES